jgi:hypothetical protein
MCFDGRAILQRLFFSDHSSANGEKYLIHDMPGHIDQP